MILLSSKTTTADAYQHSASSSSGSSSTSTILPGTGLYSSTTQDKIVIFEHTNRGTGGLVLNCPTPVRLGALHSPRFEAFAELPLMLGCGLEDEEEEEDSCGGGGNGDGNTNNDCIPLTQVAPWFWLHNVPNLPGSFALTGAAGPLYMGGNLDALHDDNNNENNNNNDNDDNNDNNTTPNASGRKFKFFRKYKQWEAGQLQREVQEGKWEVMPQDPVEALALVLPSIEMI